ncbi:hypothetical protein PG985_014766 [Apiospora marii]|uniref:Uncharacterized protein n=1 Tax=Apiospora marii TaxID=335849 RepID=A0ABR1R417_9PEZI
MAGLREVVPHDEALVPFMEAFGRGCLQMPKLRSAELSAVMPARLHKGEDGDKGDLAIRCTWGVWYFCPGVWLRGREVMDPAFSEDVQDRRLFWDVKDWRPPAHLQTLFRAIGRERDGTHLVEKFVDSWSTVRRQQVLQETGKRWAYYTG